MYAIKRHMCPIKSAKPYKAMLHGKSGGGGGRSGERRSSRAGVASPGAREGGRVVLVVGGPKLV
jgi:hypothetical protein